MYSKAWGWRLIVVLLAMAAPISGAEPASAEELVVDNTNLDTVGEVGQTASGC